MPKNFYAVFPGWKPGIYWEWYGESGALKASAGYPGEKHPGFSSYGEAYEWYCNRTGNEPPYIQWHERTVRELLSDNIQQVQSEEIKNLRNFQILPLDKSQVRIEIFHPSNKNDGFLKEYVPYIGGSIKTQDIGLWGEEFAALALLIRFQYKYSQSTLRETQDGFELYYNNQRIVEIYWCNKREETKESPDIIVDENSEKTYWEVKATTGQDKTNFKLTPNEEKFARENGKFYHILRVCGAGSAQASVYEIENPYYNQIFPKITDSVSLAGSEKHIADSITDTEKVDKEIKDADERKKKLYETGGNRDSVVVELQQKPQNPIVNRKRDHHLRSESKIVEEERISNKKFAETDRIFLKACEIANVKPTKRQASKFYNGKGKAFLSKNEAITIIRSVQ